MKSSLGPQMDLLNENFSNGLDTSGDVAYVYIQLEQRAWLRFLNEEWLHSSVVPLLLAQGGVVGLDKDISGVFVAVAFDRAKLPNIEVEAWQNNKWVSKNLSGLDPDDRFISWSAPLPLFAVDHFIVNDAETRFHLSALVRSFADIEPPEQPIRASLLQVFTAPTTVPSSQKVFRTPEQWDAFRGAATLALEAVPLIKPWLKLCERYVTGEDAACVAQDLEVPWLSTSIWKQRSEGRDVDIAFWQAMIEEFSRPGIRKEWKARELLDAVCYRARLFGVDDDKISQVYRSTKALLQDEVAVQDLGVEGGLLNLAFQLVLLRPRPEQFFEWKRDWPGIPPGAWWTGAILVGYITGFRAIPMKYRGATEARKRIAVYTWAVEDSLPVEYRELQSGDVGWSVDADVATLSIANRVIKKLNLDEREKWYVADLEMPTNRRSAELICPNAFREKLIIDKGVYPYNGDSDLSVDVSKQSLVLGGSISIDMSSGIRITREFDKDKFRKFVAIGIFPNKIPVPLRSHQQINVSVNSDEELRRGEQALLTDELSSSRPDGAANLPQGLTLIDGFISESEEENLLGNIYSHPWDDGMQRRVQHYGWRYDYKARKVNPSAYIGPLPQWLASLAERLLDQGLVSECPDQVIINEYVGLQGITRHIDCPSCFRGPIVTLSLLEAWEMVFTKRVGNKAVGKYKLMLPRRSAAVLAGDARDKWHHEIPKRLSENGVARGTRVSITFRKVDIDAKYGTW